VLDDEVGEQRREIVVAWPQRAGGHQVALGKPDQDATDRAELRHQVGDGLREHDPGGIPAVPRVRADEPTVA